MGQKFDIYEHQNKTLKYVFDKYILPNCPNQIIQCALKDAQKMDINKTLYQNNITQNSIVVIFTITKPDEDTFSNIIHPNKDFEKCLNFIINGCKVPIELLDKDGDCFEGWRVGSKNGPSGYLKNYFPPIGWYGIGLKVWNLYDDGDNTWLYTSHKNGEWYIAYHPINSVESIRSILNIGLRRGPYQGCKHYINMNPLTNGRYPECGEGVYFIPDIAEVNVYTKNFNYFGENFKVALMCRVNPYTVRIASTDYLQESWIVNGDRLDDPNGRKRDDEVRPYRILVLLSNKII